MPENSDERGPANPSRVNIHDSWEVEYWCKELACTEFQLRRAVNAVGSWIEYVRAYLKDRN